MNTTKIEWVHEDPRLRCTWNPVVGCSNDCAYCYARALAMTRLAHLCPKCATFEPHEHRERLGQPASTKKPCGVFVASMGELFDPALPDAAVARGRVFDAMRAAPWHHYYLLTKRPTQFDAATVEALRVTAYRCVDGGGSLAVGVSVESDVAWERALALARMIERPVARFLSCEPLLGDVRETILACAGHLDWVILGAQSGHKPTPPATADVARWLVAAHNACREQGVPVFVKDSLANVALREIGNVPQERPRRPTGY
jgi:protein gp37